MTWDSAQSSAAQRKRGGGRLSRRVHLVHALSSAAPCALCGVPAASFLDARSSVSPEPHAALSLCVACGVRQQQRASSTARTAQRSTAQHSTAQKEQQSSATVDRQTCARPEATRSTRTLQRARHVTVTVVLCRKQRSTEAEAQQRLTGKERRGAGEGEAMAVSRVPWQWRGAALRCCATRLCIARCTASMSCPTSGCVQARTAQPLKSSAEKNDGGTRRRASSHAVTA